MKDMEQYPLIPLRDILVYPGITKPIIIGRPKSSQALDMANNTDKLLFLTLQKDSQENEPTIDELHRVGVVVQIRQLSKLPDGTAKALVEGLYPATIEKIIDDEESCRYAVVNKREEKEIDHSELSVMRPVLEKALDEYAKATGKLSPELIFTVMQTGDINLLLYTIAETVSAMDTETSAIEKQQEVINKDNIEDRLVYVVEMMHTELEILKLDERIRQRVKHQMSKSNREYHLNEQMKAIQKEMGRDDDFKADLEEIEQKLKDLDLPDEVRSKVERELRKLKLMAPMSAESTVVRNYLDWLASLPWGIRTDDNLDVNHAEDILNRDHYGLEKPKERILEYLAVRKIAKNMKGPIICFVGPPGVGKTSLAKSIAESMGRKFVRMSMGGVRDEAEIRGHRKTYIGSMPGKIIQSVRKAGSENPVFLLDEIDKLGSDYRGDPAAALLEALDPEQNKHFVDHYLEVDFDLSKVFFITTANSIESIPSALLDRMELIRISGYTEHEKFHIARKYLIPKQLKEHCLAAGNEACGVDKADDEANIAAENAVEDENITPVDAKVENLDEKVIIDDDTIYELIRFYTKEAGVRNLEREIASLVRKSARKLTKNEDLAQVEIKAGDVEEYLGKRKFTMHGVYDDYEVGVATGLAWTPYGGDLLQIEVAMSEGSGKLMVTGQLGDVMKESAQTAFSVAKSKAGRFDIPAYRFKEYDFHLHVPEGATPKDGPSAGVTMTTALVSAAADRPVNCRIAMTGEITLRGKALPVGGIKEKVLAAHRAGLKEIILPKENEKDLTDIPCDVRKEIQFHLVKNIDELFDLNILNKSGVMTLGS